MGWLLGIIIVLFVLVLIPEILIIPILFMEFILRLFGKSFDDKPNK